MPRRWLSSRITRRLTGSSSKVLVHFSVAVFTVTLPFFHVVSHLCASSKTVLSPASPDASLDLRARLVLLWCPPSRFLLAGGTGAGSVSSVVDVGFCVLSAIVRRSSDQRSSLTRRTQRAHTVPVVCCAQMPIGEMALAEPHSKPQPVNHFRSGILQSVCHLGKMSQHGFPKCQHSFTPGPSCGAMKRESRCVTDDALHQCAVISRSVSCVSWQCDEQRAHLSLLLFLIVFNNSITLMRTSWCAADDCSFHTVCTCSSACSTHQLSVWILTSASCK